MENKLNSLIVYVQAEGRVCPLPNFWNDLWQMLPGRRQKENGGWEPPVPLILAAWWDTTAEAKQERLVLHVNYAAKYGFLDKVDSFLRGLAPNQWAYGDGITRWSEWTSKKL